jgi:hypothetical protein
MLFRNCYLPYLSDARNRAVSVGELLDRITREMSSPKRVRR